MEVIQNRSDCTESKQNTTNFENLPKRYKVVLLKQVIEVVL